MKPEHNLIDGAVCTTQVYGFYAIDGMGQRGYFNGHRDRVIWQVGKDYAIQPGRTAKSVGRYRVEAIWRQDVRTLTAEQCKAEGWEIKPLDQVTQEPALWFLRLWVSMHDPVARARLGHKPREQWLEYLNQLPAERYIAWRMTIRVLWSTVDWNAPAVAALHLDQTKLY